MRDEFSILSQCYKDCIEVYLDKKCFNYPMEPQKTLFEAMRYSLLAGGKRLRPIFVFDFCRMCGGDWKAAASFAAAVEMIHTYSLIHDDLPCMDNDDYRRGKLTNHKVFGEATAVLAGDALLTSAFTQLSAAPFSAETRIKAVEILSTCAGEIGMVGGQSLDIESEKRQCTTQDVLDIQSRKTGALIRAACKLGVLAGNGNEQQLSDAEDFASHLGLAFQIRDDILDVIGDPNELGKKTGTDECKNTFVKLLGLSECEKKVQYHTEIALNHLNHFPNNSYMATLAKQLTQRTK